MTQTFPTWPDPDDDLDDDLDDFLDDAPPRPPLTAVTPAQAAELFATVEAAVTATGCDNTLRTAQRWAADRGLRWSRLRTELEGYGGFCDCEILFNVAPEPEQP